MNLIPRALGALLAVVLVVGAASAQDAAPASERDKVGYMAGLDAGRSIGAGLQDLDQAAFARAMANAMDGGEALLPEAEARLVLRQLVANIGARRAGKPVQALDRVKAGLVVGDNIGNSLANLRGEFDMPMFLRGLNDGADPARAPLLDAGEIARVRAALAARTQAAGAQHRRTAHEAALEREQAFFAANGKKQGVYTTPSGLQYQVLHQGKGVRPRPGQAVTVNYAGTLLDGTAFDSTAGRGEPTRLRLDSVIPGWAEGLSLMPVGARYRFWIPSRMAYGSKGSPPRIPPDAALIFDVELLGIE